jgi:uncharacterized protein YndB with AHSA1/START domain
MTYPEITHGKFVIERSYAASPAQVFAAWADPAVKAEAGPYMHLVPK